MWYVYDKETTQIIKQCRTRAAAQAWRTRKHKQHIEDTIDYHSGPLFLWGCADAEYFHSFIEQTRRVKNLQSGAEVELPVNTPRCLDPSTELYWTM